MDLSQMRKNLSIKSKNGISFLMAGSVIWGLITVIYLLPLDIREQNLLMLFSTGLMFPLSIVFSKLLHIDWKSKDNPLGELGLYLNLAQLVYFPMLFWMFVSSPYEMNLFFAMITAAHFFPFGWLYRTKLYTTFSPIIVLLVFFIGTNLNGENLWMIPCTMLVSLTFLNVFLFVDYRKKAEHMSKQMKGLQFTVKGEI
ncbi:hypothetical protein [Sporosarcina sp. HYO08]|uniref:DUF7010 family protein n=1 Tax=Sporosarcina sp. HYO08 TaxID=1759557 RepID=UPI000791DB14|nr:hypothetical protein [Sporosarcina sp. HYO08]KXH86885.1 hypothetical protein AU377_13705 [Sporosarcina sp. HYO08]